MGVQRAGPTEHLGKTCFFATGILEPNLARNLQSNPFRCSVGASREHPKGMPRGKRHIADVVGDLK